MMMCECGQPVDPDLHVWNGRDLMPVCMECYNNIEAVATESCVRFAENVHESLEECTRIELGFRIPPIPWTPEIQAHIDKCYCEWYLEWREDSTA